MLVTQYMHTQHTLLLSCLLKCKLQFLIRVLCTGTTHTHPNTHQSLDHVWSQATPTSLSVRLH